MSYLEEAQRLRPYIVRGSQNLDDKTSSEVPTLFDGMKYDGQLIVQGIKINWNGQLKRAAVDLYDTELNNPDNAPTLWEDIMYKDGIRIIPEIITPGLAFEKDELGWWKEQKYKSLVDANIYTPEQYPKNWELIE